MTKMTGKQGFTLIELMITIAIVAILTALALPSFQNFIRRNAVSSEVNLLIASLQTARTLALSGNFLAGVCVSKVPPAVTCTDATSGRYDTGTAVFTRASNIANNEVPVSYVEETRGNVVQLIPSDEALDRITFNRLGRLANPAVGVEFVACYNGENTPNVQGVSIFVSQSGRISSVRLPALATCTPNSARSSY